MTLQKWVSSRLVELCLSYEDIMHNSTKAHARLLWQNGIVDLLPKRQMCNYFTQISLYKHWIHLRLLLTFLATFSKRSYEHTTPVPLISKHRSPNSDETPPLLVICRATVGFRTLLCFSLPRSGTLWRQSLGFINIKADALSSNVIANITDLSNLCTKALFYLIINHFYFL